MKDAPTVSLDEKLEISGVPWRYRQGWSRDQWSEVFSRPWPAEGLSGWKRKTSGCQMLIYGGTNSGKTGLATILISELIEKGRSGQWIEAKTFLDMLTREYSAQKAGHPQASRCAFESIEQQRRCRSVEVLVLDDLFAARRATDYALEALRSLVGDRYNDGSLTVVTTNRSPHELMSEAYLPSLGSRLTAGVVLSLGGENRARRELV